ncbi:helix-turn-helix transcriptional regulator [Kitasatospora sp. NPDC002965]|uniref:helix-turn-helix transcriptional regulator n=1 Tax=Kitasatospora sp. NPDC002965 TaxID=3154775 RepID=UPI0033AE10A0
MTEPGGPAAPPGRGAALAVTVVAEGEMHRHGIAGMLRALPLVGEVTTKPHDRIGSPVELWRADVVVLVCAEEVAPWARAVFATPRGEARLLVLLGANAAREPGSWATARVDGFLPLEQLTTAVLEDSLRRLVLRRLPAPGRVRTGPRVPDQRGGLPGVAGGALTGRERQTLGLLVEGLSNKEIAARLGISVHGAKRHVTMVLAKLNCPNRTLAVAIALRYGIVDPVGAQETGTGPRVATNSAM